MAARTHKTICMWSGPRNLSTAMMRSFENRADCHVWDEPFFAPWLAVTGKAHPGREETLAAHESDPSIVARQCLAPPPGGQSIYFQKHMPHHMADGFALDWTTNCSHFFLIRNPESVIASYAKSRADFESDDIGFWPQIRLYESLTAQGHRIPIVDCDDILADPEAVLTSLCAALGIAFDPAMLAWPAGPRETDGAWAPWWYSSVESSTGFAPPRTHKPVVPARYHDMARACLPAYDALYDKRLSSIV